MHGHALLEWSWMHVCGFWHSATFAVLEKLPLNCAHGSLWVALQERGVEYLTLNIAIPPPVRRIEPLCCRWIRCRHRFPTPRLMLCGFHIGPFLRDCCFLQMGANIIHFAVWYLIYEIFGEFFMAHDERFPYGAYESITYHSQSSNRVFAITDIPPIGNWLIDKFMQDLNIK